MSIQPCPCGGTQYANCCQPLHDGQVKAQNAEQLMRSRYSAFHHGKVDYIVATTARGQQAALEVEALREWSEANQWLGLEVLQHQQKLGKYHAMVEFKAHYHDGKQQQIHHEVSYFVKQDEQWYFLDPTVSQVITMKQACICGSGKKFKQCCAQYL